MDEAKFKKVGDKVEEISEETMVVSELPQQQVKSGLSEDGKTKYTFVTVNEALTEILELVRAIKKGIVG